MIWLYGYLACFGLAYLLLLAYILRGKLSTSDLHGVPVVVLGLLWPIMAVIFLAELVSVPEKVASQLAKKRSK